MAELLTKEKLRALRLDMDVVLSQLCEKHGLQFLKTAACTFDRDGSFTFKVEGVTGSGLTKEASRYQHHLDMTEGTANQLPPLGFEFWEKNGTNGKRFKVAGMNTTGTKVLVDVVEGPKDGKQYWYRTDALRAIYYGRQKKTGT